MGQLKYGINKNEKSALNLSAPMGASEIIPAGGAFVKNDGSGRMEIAGDQDALLAGFVYPIELDSDELYQTCSSTEGATVVPFIPISSMLGVSTRLPITDGTYVATMLGETADLEVVSNMQGVKLDASSEDTVTIVGGLIDGTSENGGYVDVVPSVEKITSVTGVV